MYVCMYVYLIVPLELIEYGVYGDLTIIYPKPHSIHLRGTISLNLKPEPPTHYTKDIFTLAIARVVELPAYSVGIGALPFTGSKLASPRLRASTALTWLLHSNSNRNSTKKI